jgi:hypothetical protein
MNKKAFTNNLTGSCYGNHALDTRLARTILHLAVYPRRGEAGCSISDGVVD